MTYVIKISASYLSDHLDRLYETEDGTNWVHVDSLWYVEHGRPDEGCGGRITELKKGKTTATISLNLGAVEEMYSDASYQAECCEGQPKYQALARRVMASIRKQVPISDDIIRKWG